MSWSESDGGPKGSLKSFKMLSGTLSTVVSELGGAEDDEGAETFGGAEGPHLTQGKDAMPMAELAQTVVFGDSRT